MGVRPIERRVFRSHVDVCKYVIVERYHTTDVESATPHSSLSTVRDRNRRNFPSSPNKLLPLASPTHTRTQCFRALLQPVSSYFHTPFHPPIEQMERKIRGKLMHAREPLAMAIPMIWRVDGPYERWKEEHFRFRSNCTARGAGERERERKGGRGRLQNDSITNRYHFEAPFCQTKFRLLVGLR